MPDARQPEPPSDAMRHPRHQREGAIKVTLTGDGEAVGGVMCRCGQGFYGKRPTIIEANEQALGALLAHIALEEP